MPDDVSHWNSPSFWNHLSKAVHPSQCVPLHCMCFRVFNITDLVEKCAWRSLWKDTELYSWNCSFSQDTPKLIVPNHNDSGNSVSSVGSTPNGMDPELNAWNEVETTPYAQLSYQNTATYYAHQPDLAAQVNIFELTYSPYEISNHPSRGCIAMFYKISPVKVLKYKSPLHQ